MVKEDARRSGFTLIEILVVITLLALLATIVTSTHRTTARKGRETVLRNNLQQIRITLDQYNTDKGHYPPSLETLVDEGYLREMPLDPITKSSATWQIIFDQSIENEDSSYEVGVFDVKSGSEEVALDGTYYYEW